MKICLVACALLLTTLVVFSLPATAANSPDGSFLLASSGSGSLTTSAGTWAFGGTGSGGNLVLLNGNNADGGSGKEMFVGNGGNLYVKDNEQPAGHWFEWNASNSTWTHLYATSPFPISANKSSMTPSSTTDLVTIQGIWAFSTSTGSGGNLVLLNGASANSGSAESLWIENGGQVYAKNNAGNWYFWSTVAGTWNATTDPTVTTFRPYCASAVVVGLQWSAVSGASTYSISRNNSSIESGTELLSYTDQGVEGGTTYSYVLTALNSSGGTVGTPQDLTIKTPAATPTGDPPYCPSNTIAGMTWNWSTGITQLDDSDLWDATWGGSDGNTYLFWGDGPGFFGSLSGGDTDKASFGFGELTLTPPSPGTKPVLTTSNAINIYGGPNTQHLASISGKVNGIIAIETNSVTNFYGVGGIWEPADGKTAKEPYQIYSEPNHIEIVYSQGNAYSWVGNGNLALNTNWQFCNASMGNGSLCPTSFINFGKGVGTWTDGYVYMLGATYGRFVCNTNCGNECNCVYLIRVLPSNILTYTDYQILTGFSANGTPVWTTNGWTQMYPIFEDSGPRGLPLGKVVYNPTLKRFIGLAQGDVNQDAFYDAPNPWGPWTLIAYYQSDTSPANVGGWGNLGTTSFDGNNVGAALGINFMNQWTSSDGLTMWATFSSDGTASSSAYLSSLANESMDSFNLVSVTLSLF